MKLSVQLWMYQHCKRLFTFVRYWLLEWTSERFMFRTPLFCLVHNKGARCWDMDARLLGWELLLWPTRWDFNLPEGAFMFRKKYAKISLCHR